MCCFLLGVVLISIGCSKVDPVMPNAGVMTIPRYAKYSKELAVATCENRGGKSSGPSFGFGLVIHKSY